MIICSCFGTTDREIRAAFGPGGSGKCPAGRSCGGCIPAVRDIVTETRQRRAAESTSSAEGAPARRARG